MINVHLFSFFFLRVAKTSSLCLSFVTINFVVVSFNEANHLIALFPSSRYLRRQMQLLNVRTEGGICASWLFEVQSTELEQLSSVARLDRPFEK